MPRSTKSPNGSDGAPKPVARSKKGNGSAAVIPEQDVARRAYEIYESHGSRDGFDLDDWLEAERELKPAPSSITGPKPRRRKTQSDIV